MSDLMKVGPDYGGTGTFKPFTAGITAAQRTIDAHGRYFDTTMRGNVYFANVNGAAATAFTGGAAGTPLVGLYNPANSGKMFSILAASVGIRVSASAAGVATFNLWGGPSVLPTGTRTNPTNMLSLAASGSAAACFVNTAMTSSTAIAQLFPVASYYWATAANANLASNFVDIGGAVIVTPGNLVALGATAALTSATYDASLVWEELPYLT